MYNFRIRRSGNGKHHFITFISYISIIKKILNASATFMSNISIIKKILNASATFIILNASATFMSNINIIKKILNASATFMSNAKKLFFSIIFKMVLNYFNYIY